MNVKKNDLEKRNCLYGDIFFTASSETVIEQAKMMASEFSKIKTYERNTDNNLAIAAEPT